MFSTSAFKTWAGDYLWAGTSKHKGLGIFPKKGNVVRSANWSGSFTVPGVANRNAAQTWTTSDLKLFLPFVLNETYSVLGVWTKADGAKVFRYIGQLWKYLQIHKYQLRGESTILMGDFNSNKIWDKPDRWWNHTDVIEELELIGLRSIYHAQELERQGQESKPTFFLQRNESKAYHIDYAFASDDLLAHCSVEIGEKSDWLGVSDHMPVSVEISR